MKKRTLSAAVLAGAIIASSTPGIASALEKDTTQLPEGTSTFNASDEVNQSDAKPQMKKVDAQVDKVKTINLDKKDVNVLGASWEGDDPDLRIRYKTDDGWSGWEELPKDDEGGPDLNSKEGKQAEKFAKNKDGESEVIPVLNSSKVQIKSTDKKSDTDNLEITNVATEVTEEDKQIASRNDSPELGSSDTVQSGYTTTVAPSPGTTVAMSNVTTPAAKAALSAMGQEQEAPPIESATLDSQQAAEVSSASYNSGFKGNIVTRKEWGANEKLKRCGVSSAGKAKGIFIHHTAGSNSYTKAQAPGIIRGYLSYHTQSKGWCDLGYNFLVDKYGTVYEGRTGSINKAIVGAHASGFNSGTIGISVMGTFTKSAPSKAAQDAVKRVVAWKSNTYGLNPTGKVTLTSGGGGTSKYSAGRKVSLNVVSGHRDTSYTECPGLAFYNKLGSIRSGSKALQPKLKDDGKVGGSTPGKYVTKGKIGAYYKKNKSKTGAPTSNEGKIKSPSGNYQRFKKGTVYYSKNSGAHFNMGVIRKAFKKTGYTGGSLGYPTTDNTKFKYNSKAKYQKYQHGMITYSKATGAKAMTTTMYNKWKSMGSERSVAKLPTKNMKCGLKDGGCYQSFEGGSLHWSKKSGVHFTKKNGAFQRAWKKNGYENGKLGYPTTDKYKSGSKLKQKFQGGYMTYTKKTGAKVYYNNKYVTKGAIGTYYKKNESKTGAPTSNEGKIKSPSGNYQRFKKGTVYYSKNSGAHFNMGVIRKAFKKTGYTGGSLGYPTTDNTKFKYNSKAKYQKYQKGMITYSKATGAKAMTSTMYNKWKSMGSERSVAKLPTKNMKCGLKDGGCYQQFEKGKLHWSKKSGVHFTLDKGAFQRAWIKAGGSSGKLGYPTTDKYKSGSKLKQKYQGGYMTYTKKTGAKVYYNSK